MDFWICFLSKHFNTLIGQVMSYMIEDFCFYCRVFMKGNVFLGSHLKMLGPPLLILMFLFTSKPQQRLHLHLKVKFLAQDSETLMCLNFSPLNHQPTNQTNLSKCQVIHKLYWRGQRFFCMLFSDVQFKWKYANVFVPTLNERRNYQINFRVILEMGIHLNSFFADDVQPQIMMTIASNQNLDFMTNFASLSTWIYEPSTSKFEPAIVPNVNHVRAQILTI